MPSILSKSCLCGKSCVRISWCCRRRARFGNSSTPCAFNRGQRQRLLPAVNAEGRFIGVLTRGDIRLRIEQEGEAALDRTLDELVRHETVEASPNEPLRMVVYRMAERGITRMPVIEPSTRKFLGVVSLADLLKARTRHLEEERRREQVLSLRFFLPGGEVKDEKRTPAAP